MAVKRKFKKIYFGSEVTFKGILLIAFWCGCRATDMVNEALNRGSSKQGNAIRAYVGSNCVVANHLEKIMKYISLLQL